MTDRFTQACSELTERNPYLCESCNTTFGHPAIMHLGGDPGMTDQRTGPDPLRSGELDSMPFGD